MEHIIICRDWIMRRLVPFVADLVVLFCVCIMLAVNLAYIRGILVDAWLSGASLHGQLRAERLVLFLAGRFQAGRFRNRVNRHLLVLALWLGRKLNYTGLAVLPEGASRLLRNGN
ncbi:hypothetical protein CYR55_14055 [Chimaeribacter californicus]|uniref:Uncharacterized protein n=1 Tax=Chimaeribacter californicus TaxID=2060067 RepID=A0A2N5E2U8_9GAMM|nr:hypothetical protein [Chimaeribacter californicus]PLR35024.1 hypothetical protein CYR55_14055 [Chimaeribacter californicus]